MKIKTLTVALALSLVVALAGPAVGDTAFEEAWSGVKVRTALLTELGWDLVDVDVEVRDGVAYLSGLVETRERAELAEEVALSVEGIEKVRSDVRLVDEAGSPSAAEDVDAELKDALLESRAKGALFAEIGADAMDIEVEAANETISLRGEVDDEETETQALACIEALDGVSEVIDLIRVAPAR